MACCSCYSFSTVVPFRFQCQFATIPNHEASFPSNPRNLFAQFPSVSRFTATCGDRTVEGTVLSCSSAYGVLGVEPSCSSVELKAAFRAKVKKYHPDVSRDVVDSEIMIRRIIQAYEILTDYSRSEIIERECVDPFDDPLCEATDIFVNEALCVGKGCSYSCVKRAPHALTFSETGTARANSQGHGEDYQVQIAVGQCPRSCIHYVTPSQRIILEELLDSSILKAPHNSSAEGELLYSLIVKARFENNRFRKPKKQPKS